MGWSIGYDERWKRDIGYGVPAICDHPECNTEIDRGLAYVCGDDPYGGEHGCGLFFCQKHKSFEAVPVGSAALDDDECDAKSLCQRCSSQQEPFSPKPETYEWLEWKLTDESWQHWRDENPEEVQQMKKLIEVK